MSVFSSSNQEQPIVVAPLMSVSNNGVINKQPKSFNTSMSSPATGAAKNSRGSAGSASSAGTSNAIGTKPTLIDVQPMHFLIMDAPRQGNLFVYIKEMRKHHVTDIVRVCEPTYRPDELSSAGITLHDLEFKDGTSPSKELVMTWLQLVEKTFYESNPASSGGSSPPRIAIHCVAGLGRAPQMVAIALIEFANMDPVEAVSFIRSKRRGAINEKQLLYLEGYKKQYPKRKGGGSGGEGSCGCVVS